MVIWMLLCQRARWVELTNVLQAIQKGLALEKERTLTSMWDSPLQGHAAGEPDLVAAEVMVYFV